MSRTTLKSFGLALFSKYNSLRLIAFHVKAEDHGCGTKPLVHTLKCISGPRFTLACGSAGPVNLSGDQDMLAGLLADSELHTRIDRIVVFLAQVLILNATACASRYWLGR